MSVFDLLKAPFKFMGAGVIVWGVILIPLFGLGYLHEYFWNISLGDTFTEMGQGWDIVWVAVKGILGRGLKVLLSFSVVALTIAGLAFGLNYVADRWESWRYSQIERKELAKLEKDES